MFGQLFPFVLNVVKLEGFLLLLWVVDNLFFYNWWQLISISKVQIIREFWTQVLEDLKWKDHGCRAGPNSREEEDFLTTSSFDLNGQDHISNSVSVPDVPTIRPDRHKEERQKQMRWMSSACQQVMVWSGTCYCLCWPDFELLACHGSHETIM